jgi:hypothetical protein
MPLSLPRKPRLLVNNHKWNEKEKQWKKKTHRRGTVVGVTFAARRAALLFVRGSIFKFGAAMLLGRGLSLAVGVVVVVVVVATSSEVTSESESLALA